MTLSASELLAPARMTDPSWIAVTADMDGDGRVELRADMAWQDVANKWIDVWLMTPGPCCKAPPLARPRADTGWRSGNPKEPLPFPDEREDCNLPFF
jgi:hypothetical protein